jgi:hypothetical protein
MPEGTKFAAPSGSRKPSFTTIPFYFCLLLEEGVYKHKGMQTSPWPVTSIQQTLAWSHNDIQS